MPMEDESRAVMRNLKLQKSFGYVLLILAILLIVFFNRSSKFLNEQFNGLHIYVGILFIYIGRLLTKRDIRLSRFFLWLLPFPLFYSFASFLSTGNKIGWLTWDVFKNFFTGFSKIRFTNEEVFIQDLSNYLRLEKLSNWLSTRILFTNDIIKKNSFTDSIEQLFSLPFELPDFLNILKPSAIGVSLWLILLLIVFSWFERRCFMINNNFVSIITRLFYNKLRRAVKRGKSEKVQKLLKKYRNKDKLQFLCKTLMRPAIKNNNIEIVKSFIELGVKINSGKPQMSMLYFSIDEASSREDFSIPNFLVKSGADVDEMFNLATGYIMSRRYFTSDMEFFKYLEGYMNVGFDINRTASLKVRYDFPWANQIISYSMHQVVKYYIDLELNRTMYDFTWYFKRKNGDLRDKLKDLGAESSHQMMQVLTFPNDIEKYVCVRCLATQDVWSHSCPVCNVYWGKQIPVKL